MCQGPKEHLCGAQAVRLGRGRRHCYPPTPPNQLKARARLLSWSTREPLKVLKQWCGMVRVGLDLPHMLDRGPHLQISTGGKTEAVAPKPKSQSLYFFLIYFFLAASSLICSA